MPDALNSVAFCGFVCTACGEALPQKAGCPGCRAGGGEAGCRQRRCCEQGGIAGCWQCDTFPCDEGFATDGHDPAFRGFWLTSVRGVREHGLERYATMVEARLGPAFDHAAFRGRSEEEIREVLEGAPPRQPPQAAPRASVTNNEVRGSGTRATSNSLPTTKDEDDDEDDQ